MENAIAPLIGSQGDVQPLVALALDKRLIDKRFPRSSKYHPEWIISNASGEANPLWLTEWLTTMLNLQPGMRVLDLGYGRASSSFFLHREFGIQVWATDLFALNIERSYYPTTIQYS